MWKAVVFFFSFFLFGSLSSVVVLAAPSADSAFLLSQKKPVLFYVCLNVRGVAEDSARHPCRPSFLMWEKFRKNSQYAEKIEFVNQTIGRNRMEQLMNFSSFLASMASLSQWDLAAPARFLFLEGGRLVGHLEANPVKEDVIDKTIKQVFLGTRSVPVSLLLSPHLFEAVERQSQIHHKTIEEVILQVIETHFFPSNPSSKAVEKR